MSTPRLALALAATVALAAAGCGSSASDDEPATTATAAAATTADAPEPAPEPEGRAAPAPAAGARLAQLGDDFSKPATLEDWGLFPGDFGPAEVEVADGELRITPPQSTWVHRDRGVHVFRRAKGDFDATARVQVTGTDGRPAPRQPWSLGGLLVRDAEAPAGRGENWLAVRIGRVGGEWVYEEKTTTGSQSVLELTPARGGWHDLRVTRRGGRFTLSARPARDGDGGWQELATYSRPDLGPVLDVGFDPFSGSPREGGTGADLVLHVDEIAFAAS